MLNFLFLTGILLKVETAKPEYIESRKLSEGRNLPLGDCITAVQARNNNAIVITQDSHFFNNLRNICKVEKP